MDKYAIYNDIYERLIHSTILADKTDEGRLMVAVVGQAIQDAMGLYGADKELLYIPHKPGARGKRDFVTEQQAAINWFKANSV